MTTTLSATNCYRGGSFALLRGSRLRRVRQKMTRLMQGEILARFEEYVLGCRRRPGWEDHAHSADSSLKLLGRRLAPTQTWAEAPWLGAEAALVSDVANGLGIAGAIWHWICGKKFEETSER
jgi:hypothetical protein